MGTEVSGGVYLGYCGSSLQLSEMDFELVANRGSFESFRLVSETSEQVHVLELNRGVSSSKGWIVFDSHSGAAGAFRQTSSGIEVHPNTNAIGISLALRGLFSRAIEQRGGILAHASGVSWDGQAALITGVSGAGKSTLARWSLKAGATLLSDEVVGVLPDGTVLGTPFRSDMDLHGSPTSAQLRVLMTLRHDAFESFEQRPAHELVRALSEQAFHRDGQVSAAEVLRCVAGAVRGVRTGVFACRNEPSAGLALREIVMSVARQTRG